MKNFVCSNCGTQVRRPTAPLRCESCGQARIGLFRVADGPAAGAPPAPAGPPRPEAPIPPPPSVGMPSMPPSRPAVPPAAPSMPPPIPAAPASYQPPPRAAAPVPPASPMAPQSPPPVSPPISSVPPAPPSGDASWKRPGGRIPTRPTDDDVTPPRTTPPPEPIPPPIAQPPVAQPPRQAPPSQPPPGPPRRTEATPPAAPREPERQAPAASKERPPASKPSTTSAQPGAVVWKFPLPSTGNPPRRQAIRSSPAVDSEGNIYAAVGPSLVALTETAHGIEQQWSYDLDCFCPGPVVLASDGRLRAHGGDGRLHCISLTGQTSFEPIQVGEPLGWAAPVADADGNTYISGYNGGIFKVGSQGNVQRNAYLATRQKFDSTGCISKGSLYIGCEDGFVYSIELVGSRGYNKWDPLANQGKTGWFINSSPAPGLDGQWIVAGRDEYLYAFQPDGSLASKLHIRGQMLASPVVSPAGHAYVGVSLERRGDQSRGKLVCVDLASHRVRWEYDVNRPIESTPVIGDDGIVYVGDNSGTVHAINAEGRRQWSHGVGSPVRSPGTIPSPHRVVFGLDNGHYVALMCSSKGVAKGGWPKYMGDLSQTGNLGK